MDPKYSHYRVKREGRRRWKRPPPVPESMQGENYPTAKMTDRGVLRLWELRKAGLGTTRICRQLVAEGHYANYNIVRRILEGFGWKHLRPEWADNLR